MKISWLFIISVILISCQENKKTNLNLKAETKSKIVKAIYGNFETDRRFNYFKKNSITINDSLKDRNFFNQKIKMIDCKSKFIEDNDFTNDKKDYFIREYEITFFDTLKINVLQRQNKISEYIFLYKGKPFKIRNFFGEMFSSNSDLFFNFASRQCYIISNSKFIMREQPMGWCGLANQFDFFQIIDLDKMEIIQFAEKDENFESHL